MAHGADEDGASRLLRAAPAKELASASELMPIVYDALRDLAVAYLARVPPGHLLEPTALVHEAYLRLVGDGDPGWEDQHHFHIAAARAMRDILVGHAPIRRGGRRRGVDLSKPTPEELLAIDEAFRALARKHEVPYRMIMFRVLVQLSGKHTADVFDTGWPTVSRARPVVAAFLAREMWGDQDCVREPPVADAYQLASASMERAARAWWSRRAACS